MTSLDPTDTFTAQVGVLAGASPNTFVSPAQAVRVGGSSVTVTVSNSNSAVAQLVTQAGSAQSRTATIAPGQSSSPATVPTGGTAFDPIGGGSTSVRATAPGFTATDNATQPVTVSTPGISLFSLPATVGAGLHMASSRGSWAGRHGGVTVRLESSNPALMRLSLNAITAGTAVDRHSARNGDVSFYYYIHGMEGVTGDATITASASGFTNRIGTVQVVPPALQLTSLPASMTSLDPTDTFTVQIGVPAGRPPTRSCSPAQAVRVGGSSVVGDGDQHQQRGRAAGHTGRVGAVADGDDWARAVELSGDPPDRRDCVRSDRRGQHQCPGHGAGVHRDG